MTEVRVMGNRQKNKMRGDDTGRVIMRGQTMQGLKTDNYSGPKFTSCNITI